MVSIIELANKMQEKLVELHMSLCVGILEDFKGTFTESELYSVDTLAGLMLLGAYYADNEKTDKEDDWYYHVVEDMPSRPISGLELLASRVPFIKVVHRDIYGSFEIAYSFNRFCGYKNDSHIKRSIEAIILYTKEVKARLTDAYVQRGKELNVDRNLAVSWLFEGDWKDMLVFLFHAYTAEGSCFFDLDVDMLPMDTIDQMLRVLSDIDKDMTAFYDENRGAITLRIESEGSFYERSDIQTRNLVLSKKDYLAKSFKFLVKPSELI